MSDGLVAFCLLVVVVVAVLAVLGWLERRLVDGRGPRVTRGASRSHVDRLRRPPYDWEVDE